MKKNSKQKIAILGGGIAGLSAGYHLSESVEYVIYEAKSEPGGLTSSYNVEGFTFDNAIHMSFTNNDYVKDIFSRTPHFKHSPDVFCYESRKWLKHPIQNNLHPLGLLEKFKLLFSFLIRPNKQTNNFRDWLIAQQGSEIANRYSIPYNKKYWKYPLDQINLDWVSGRFRKPNILELISGAFFRTKENHYYANEMRYPKKGGYFSFIKAISKKTNIKLNMAVRKIDLETKTLEFENGSIESYDSIISSLPLPLICGLIKNCPKNVAEASKKLAWTTVDLISIGVKKKNISPHLWFYIYDKDCSASRCYSPSKKSPHNAPMGCSSLQFEIYGSSKDKRLDKESLKLEMKKKLIDMGLCEEEDIMFIHHKHLPYGTVVFNECIEKNRKIVRDFLESKNILSIGRFGEWKYFWSDDSFLSGKKAAEYFNNKIE